MASRAEIVTAYRHLFKHGLRAVKYSKPSRFVVEERLRNAFRTSPIEAFDAARVARTLQFLDGAAKARGLEHKIVKNLMMTWWYQRLNARRGLIRKNELPFRQAAYAELERTVEMLNDTMGLCI